MPAPLLHAVLFHHRIRVLNAGDCHLVLLGLLDLGLLLLEEQIGRVLASFLLNALRLANSSRCACYDTLSANSP